MIDIFVDICKKGIELFLLNKKEQKEDRLKVAEILLDISALLKDTAEKLVIDFYPHNNCVVLERLSTELKSKILPFMSNEQSDLLEVTLKDVVLIEKQFAHRKDPETIPSIYRASGEFQAMSLLLRF